jgi:transcriptional regulator GlxA family with amidase domain
MRFSATNTKPHVVAFLVFDGIQILDLTGPAQVFGTAEALQSGSYRVVVLTQSGRAVQSTVGIEVKTLAWSKARGVGTLLVPGGSAAGLRSAMRDRDLTAWLQRRSASLTRIGSVCSGAFVLARAGLLDGRAAATHWGSADLLASLFPTVHVDREAIFRTDGGVWSSAGVTAGIDMALAMVEQDHGRALAHAVARHLVVYLRRSGGQSQFSAPLHTQGADDPRIATVLKRVSEQSDADLSAPALAAIANMTERTFQRRFREITGQTPARYVLRSRVDRAAQLLQSPTLTLEAVARRVGLRNASRLHDAFISVHGLAPGVYRKLHWGRV